MKVKIQVCEPDPPEFKLSLTKKEFDVIKKALNCYVCEMNSNNDYETTAEKMSEMLDKIKLQH